MSIQYFITLIMMLFVAGFAINGFFMSTRGYEETLPNGEVVKKGYIFKEWYFFWFQKKGFKKRYLVNDQLLELVNYLEFNGISVTLMETDLLDKVVLSKFYVTSGEVSWRDKIQVFNKFKIKLDIIDAKPDVILDSQQIHAYVEEPVYRFPAKIRDMMAGCITCHASLYGSIFFWTVHLLTSKQYIELMYGGFGSIAAGIFVTYIIFIIALAYINTWLFKIGD